MNEEAQLLAACIHKLEKGFELIYIKYVSKLKGIAFRYVGDMDKAEDILQDAFVKIYSKIQTFEPIGSLEAWLKRIVVNTAIDYYKKEKKEKKKLSDYSIDASDNEPIEDDYSIEELTESINKLPEGYKLVFNLYAIDGYSHKEISLLLNINEGTSKSQLFKARNFLKEELKKLKKVQQ